jgi:putative transposase
MKLTYVYRIKPTTEQVAVLENWLELLRRHWNYALGQRLDWLHRTRSSINYCSLLSEPIGEIPPRPNYYTQAAQLKETKAQFRDYKNIYAEVQQQNLIRLDKAWERWLKPDAKGKRGGRPRFKKQGELRSFTFPRVNNPKAGAFLLNKALKLSKIGEIPVILHRPLPDGFTPKQATIIKKADGWFVAISLEDKTVPQPMPLETVKTMCGVDVGLKEFLTTNTGQTEPVKKIYRNKQAHLARQQRKLARKQKGSKNAQKQKQKIALIHQKIQRYRQDWHYKIAHKLVRSYDLIAVEDLNIKGLARTRLGKSILDVAWGNFLTILEAVAIKRGVWFVKVNPHGTTRECSRCHQKVPKTLSVRIHECPKCNLVLEAPPIPDRVGRGERHANLELPR